MSLTVLAVRSSACKNVCSDLAEDLELQFSLPFFSVRTMFQHTLFYFVFDC